MSDSVQPHRQQPTRLPRPWDSQGKNTGVGCHFLLQCMKVKSESEVAQSCPTLCDPRDGSPPGSPVPGILKARTLEWVAISFSMSKLWEMVKDREAWCGGWLLVFSLRSSPITMVGGSIWRIAGTEFPFGSCHSHLEARNC